MSLRQKPGLSTKEICITEVITTLIGLQCPYSHLYCSLDVRFLWTDSDARREVAGENLLKPWLYF